MSNFHPLEVVGRGSETQLQMGENYVPIQNRGTFLWEFIYKTLLESVIFQLHDRMLSDCSKQALKSYGHFSDLGVEIALSHRNV